MKLRKRADVRGDGVVPVVSAEHTRDPGVLLGHGVVPSSSNFVPQTRELRASFVPGGAAFQLEPSIAVKARDVRKPEEVERSKVNDATAITLSAEHEIRAGERPAGLPSRLA